MSVDEEVELRDLVAQTLEKNGCLAKLRAEMRASIFLALDEDIKLSKQEPLQNPKIHSYLETTEGQAMFCIVREFLEFFNLHFTMSVYDPESFLGTGYNYRDRQKIAKDLGLGMLEDPSIPLLQQLVKIAQKRKNVLDINLNNNINGDNNDCVKVNSDSISVLNEQTKDKQLLNEKNSILNTTFELSSPTVSLDKLNTCEQNDKSKPHSSKVKENSQEDTCVDKSSITEEIASLSASEDNLNCSEKNNNSNGSVSVTDDKTSETERPKLPPQRTDKFKTRSSLSSLSDLPPLQINKSRVSDILPSLYSKEFKEKSNLKELDKMFEFETEYEEDFMCSGDDLTLNSEYSRSELKQLNGNSVPEPTSNKMDSEKLSVLNISETNLQ